MLQVNDGLLSPRTVFKYMVACVITNSYQIFSSNYNNIVLKRNQVPYIRKEAHTIYPRSAGLNLSCN